MCSLGLWPQSAPAAGHDRAWCHQASWNPPSRRETPTPWAPVPHEVSSTPPWRHWRLHQWGKKHQWAAIIEKWNWIPRDRSLNERNTAVTKLEIHFQVEYFLIKNLYLNKQLGSVSRSLALSCSERNKLYFKLTQLLLELFSSFHSRVETFLISHTVYPLRCVFQSPKSTWF